MNPKEFAQLVRRACDFSRDPKMPVAETMMRQILADGATIRRHGTQIGGSFFVEVFYEGILFVSESEKPFVATSTT